MLCLAVGGPIDLAAAQMLAVAFHRHGLPARSEAVERLADLGRLDLDDVRMVWLVSVGERLSTSKVRYVARRLRRSAAAHTSAGSRVAIGSVWADPERASNADRTSLDWTYPSAEAAIAVAVEAVRSPASARRRDRAPTTANAGTLP